MGNSFITENRLLGGETENVPGTAETFNSASYDVRARNLELGNLTVEFDDESSKFATGDHTRDEAIAGITTGEITFDIKVANGEWSNSATTSDHSLPYEKYLKGAGLISTYTGDDISEGYWTLTPGRDGDLQPVSLAITDVETGAAAKGIEYKLAGAMSTLTIGTEGVGKPIMANFAFQGKVAGVTEIANASLPVYSDTDGLSTIADKFFSYTVRITDLSDASTQEFCVNSFSLDTGLTISPFNCQSDAAGILYNAVTSRDPRITINPLLTTLTDWNFWSAVNSESVFKLEILGAGVEIVSERGQFISPSVGDDNGFLRNELTFRPLRNVEGATQALKEQTYSLKINETFVS